MRFYLKSPFTNSHISKPGPILNKHPLAVKIKPMSHAYLIMAHENMPLVQTLLNCLDDPRNDIYVHIDKKFGALPALTTRLSRLFLLDHRIDVRWADYSQVECELLLIQAALSDDKQYSYLHLISGADLPLHNQDYIHAFCDLHNGKEFIGYQHTEETPEIFRRTHHYHLFPRQFRSNNIIIRGLRRAGLCIQDILGIRRNKGIVFKKGAQWFSITTGLAKYFLEHRAEIKKRLQYTFCPDEVALQTLAWSSPYRDNIWDVSNEYRGCMRCINWQDGILLDWEDKDYDTLAESGAFFARKFNTKDPAFIKKIVRLSESALK